jgi:hypothetical protein
MHFVETARCTCLLRLRSANCGIREECTNSQHHAGLSTIREETQTLLPHTPLKISMYGSNDSKALERASYRCCHLGTVRTAMRKHVPTHKAMIELGWLSFKTPLKWRDKFGGKELRSKWYNLCKILRSAFIMLRGGGTSCATYPSAGKQRVWCKCATGRAALSLQASVLERLNHFPSALSRILLPPVGPNMNPKHSPQSRIFETAHSSVNLVNHTQLIHIYGDWLRFRCAVGVEHHSTQMR